MNRRYLLFIPDYFLLSMEALLKKKLGRESRDYLAITFGLICYSIGWAAFMLPYQITTGGVTGIAAIIYYATGIEIQVSYFVINAIFLGFALKILADCIAQSPTGPAPIIAIVSLSLISHSFAPQYPLDNISPTNNAFS